jgi:undecaprenyl-diphosphatase
MGVRLALSGVVTAAVLVPFTVLAALVISKSSTLARWDDAIEDAAHGYVAARPSLTQLLIVLSTATHPNVMRAATALIVLWLATRPDWRRTGWRRALWLAATMAVGGAISPLIKDVVARFRPVLDHPVFSAPGYSFPSGHAQNSMMFAACLVLMTHRATRDRRALRTVVWAAAALLVLVTGFDRVGLGVHYTSDVVAGWLVGVATVTVTTAFFQRWRLDAGLAPAPPTQTLALDDAGRAAS